MPTKRSAPLRVPARFIVVLGGTNGRDGRLSSMCVRRLRCALALYARVSGREAVAFVLTGGHGAHFNTAPHPHWWYLRRWLLRHGVSAEHIRFAVDSSRTPEDAQLTGLALRGLKPGRLDLVTSDFHAGRVQVVFARFLPGWRRVLHRSPCLCRFSANRQRELRAHEKHRVRAYRSAGVPELSSTAMRGRVIDLVRVPPSGAPSSRNRRRRLPGR